ncbi:MULTISPECIES: hypothetical protein [unclassified Streptomyces]|uniref:hypothetical protein n=1 Tax=unclassified Streptomyces TaxID=2593676 RepID=UPI002DD857F5|nr:hypothetical protein [Streptomyces sp. NBC_01775]WSB75775.1 hypothetical protein OHB04_08215 [Streptomyces sp. NBC_01775]WSS46685.1 hypothetical protein OG220_32355 [Streptomyces sp. NBC_01187]
MKMRDWVATGKPPFHLGEFDGRLGLQDPPQADLHAEFIEAVGERFRQSGQFGVRRHGGAARLGWLVP